MCIRLLENGVAVQRGIKIILQIALLVTFLAFFGVPAVRKYQRGEVMVVESIKDTDGIELPSITVVEHKAKEEQQGSCYSLNASVEECMIFKTHNLSDLIKGVMLGYRKREVQNLDKSVVSEEFAVSWVGRVFTLRLPLKIGPDTYEEQLYLLLAPNYTSVHLFLHDSRYFIFNVNPIGLSTLSTRFDAKIVGNHFQELALAEVNELDVPEDPCNSDRSYNFHACVQTSIAKEASQGKK